MFEIDGGATTSFGYEVHIAKAGKKLAPMSPIEGGKAAAVHLYGAGTRLGYGMSLTWTSPTALLVEYEQARKADLQRPVVKIGATTVSVALESNFIGDQPRLNGIIYACCQPERRVIHAPPS